MSQKPELNIVSTTDFEFDGTGTHEAWKKTEWVKLKLISDDKPQETRVKVMYSTTGIYFLFYCVDETLTATIKSDFENLYNEDVVEIFLWTDEAYPIYFEYELSPLNYELPIIVPNRKGEFFGWLPWHYEGDRRTRHATSVEGGSKSSMAKVSAWRAEFFIPYKLLRPLGNVPPKAGTIWRANMYRIDYDLEEARYYQWSATTGNFHQYNEFGTFVFK